MEIKRGDLVTIALPGDYGKPRPALVVQADHFVALPSLTVLPLTSDLRDEHLLRITIEPTGQNGLNRPSQFMIDKITTVPRTRAGKRIGVVEPRTMQIVGGALARFLALA
jgi:mRNA interferase MazF